MNRTYGVILLIILIIGAFLRFYNYASWSLSNDELSALYGTHKNDWAFMMEYIRTDFHPAGIEVFLFGWINVFGDSEVSVRLPFIICGIASLYLSFLICKKWFSESSALLLSSTMAVSQFFILYSQVARPYSFGLFFILLMVYGWTCLLFENDKRKFNVLWIIIGLAGSMYSHYFSFMFALMVAFTGLFHLKKETWKTYLISVLIGLSLFIPHIELSVIQLSYGGLGTWLGKPETDWVYSFLFYTMNNSFIFSGVIILIFILSVFYFYSKSRLSHFHRISLIWSFLPFVCAYYYSVFINPVLQYSVLIFSFPFFLMFLFSFIGSRKYLSPGFVSLVLITGIVSTTAEAKLYEKNSFGVFSQLAEANTEWTHKFYNVEKVVSVINPYYVDYYYDKTGAPKNYRYLHLGYQRNYQRLIDIVDSTQADYFSYGWSNIYDPMEAHAIIRKKFPVVKEDRKYFNSGITLFTKGKASHVLSRKEMNSSDSSILYRLPKGREFGKDFREDLYQIKISGARYISAFAEVAKADTMGELVVSFERNQKSYSWQSSRLSMFRKRNDGYTPLIIAQELPANMEPGDSVKIYFWNRDKKEALLKSFYWQTEK